MPLTLVLLQQLPSSALISASLQVFISRMRPTAWFDVNKQTEDLLAVCDTNCHNRMWCVTSPEVQTVPSLPIWHALTVLDLYCRVATNSNFLKRHTCMTSWNVRKKGGVREQRIQKDREEKSAILRYETFLQMVVTLCRLVQGPWWWGHQAPLKRR
jgi:hypothetical protein